MTVDHRAISPNHSVTVVGVGRLGSVISRLLAGAGVSIVGPLGRDDHTVVADIALLCVPDREIAAAVGALPRGFRFVGHTSGATRVTTAGVDFGLHPLMTFTGKEGPGDIAGAGCAIGGRSADATRVAHDLAVLLGLEPFEITDEERAAYHAAASLASNLVLPLLALSETLMPRTMDSSRSRAMLAHLTRATIANWVDLGPELALTGPVARGDTETVAAQRAAIARAAPHGLAPFDALCAAAADLARRAEVRT